MKQRGEPEKKNQKTLKHPKLNIGALVLEIELSLRLAFFSSYNHFNQRKFIVIAERDDWWCVFPPALPCMSWQSKPQVEKEAAKERTVATQRTQIRQINNL